MKLFFLAALLVSAVLFASSSSIKRRPGSRIIGGKPANAGQYPYAAAINIQTRDGNYFCGGALLTAQWVITSGSCVDGGILFQIQLGATNLSSSGPEVVKVATDEYYVHPDFNLDTVANDIGLIKLRLPVTLSAYIQPIDLASRELQPYAVVWAIGWGQLSDHDPLLATNLQTVQLTALSNEECKLYFGAQIEDNMVCVDGNFNEGACLGDVGGPLVQLVNVARPTIVGISSFVSGNGCESEDPSGYTRVAPYHDWIANVTGAN